MVYMNGEQAFDELLNTLNKENIDLSASSSEMALDIIDHKRQQLQQVLEQKTEITIEDRDYLKTTLKTLIELTLGVLEDARTDLKIGAAASQREAFAKLADSFLNQLKELKDLNKMLLDINLLHGDPDEEIGEQKEEKELKVTSTEMLEFFKKVKKDSELNSIEAKFDIQEEKEIGDN